MKKLLLVCGPSLLMGAAFALISPAEFKAWGWLASIAFAGIMVPAAKMALDDA